MFQQQVTKQNPSHFRSQPQYPVLIQKPGSIPVPNLQGNVATFHQQPLKQTVSMNPQEEKKPPVTKVKVSQNLQTQTKKSPTTSFKQLYSKYLKGKKPEEPEEQDEKFECLAKIISYQACKIRNLEDRLKKIENLLPVYGTFDDKDENIENEKSKKRKLDTEETVETTITENK